MQLKNILNKAYETHNLDIQEIVTLLNTDDKNVHLLYQYADKVRQEFVGDEVFLRGLIEFSSYCKNDCFYCGLRKSNKNAQRYRMSKEEIIERADLAYTVGYKTIVLQSGDDFYYKAEDLADIIKGIKEKCDVAITLSIGEREEWEYSMLKSAGADRFLMRFETSNKALYQKLHPKMTFENRINCLKILKKLGYELGTGFLVGLPEQTIEDLANDILLVKQLDADMIGIGPFISNPDTPLKDFPNGSTELTLRCIAILRLLMPDTNIPATTALGTLDPQGRQKALRCGANIIMPNVNSNEYKEKYQLYPGKICINEDAFHCKGCVENMITSQGRRVGQGYGHSRHKM